MKTLLLLLLLLMLVPPGQKPTTSQDESSLDVLGFKWSRTRRTFEKLDAKNIPLTPEMIPANKNYSRNARVNDPAGAKDPDEDTIDGRHAALEKNVQTARTPETKPIDGFAYLVRLRNASAKTVEILFWEYQFTDPSNPSNVTRRQFLCGVNIKPSKEKEVQAFSLSGPTDVVSVGTLANNSGDYQGRVLINRVEYADGSILQRRDWNFSEIRMTYKHAVETPWGSEMCRIL